MELLTKLWIEIQRQAEWVNTIHIGPGTVEIIVDDSKPFLEGGLSIGKKREALVQKAEGAYLCFLDDDDSIAPNYLQELIALCKKRRDVCTFSNISKLDNFWMIVDMSLNNPVNEQGTNGIVKRKPWHICPVKSQYAKLHSFEDINYGEDWKWFEQVLSHCRTEAHTTSILHQYNYSSKTSESDKITNNEKLFTK